MEIIKVGNTSVKIYAGESGGYPLFTVVHYANGKRIRENFRKRADAKVRAREITTAIEKGRHEILSLTLADRESYIAAMNALRPVGIPLHAAVEEYVAERAKRARQRSVIPKRVGEVVEELLVAKKRDGLSIRYIQSLRSHLRRFASSFQTNISAITAGMIESWLGKLDVSTRMPNKKSKQERRPLGPRARNNIRMSIVSLFQFAQKHGYLSKDQRTEAEQVGRAKDLGGKIGILKPKELATLLEKADSEASLYLALGAFTGLRNAELIRLEWEDINFERGHVIVAKEKSKTATRRLVPIAPNLMQWLAPYRGRTGKIFVSEHAAERTISFAKAHMDWPANCLRHSFASYRLADTHDAARTALELGNSPTMLFTNYRELSDEHDAKAWFAITPKRPKNVVAMAAAS
jgi:integrase